MIIDSNYTSDTYGASLVKMIYAYNVEIARVWIYEQTTSNGVEISNSNAITLEDYIGYGKATNIAGKGVYVHNYATVRLIRPDIENCNCGIYADGAGAVTNIENPYSERCIVNILHNSSTGLTTVTGGLLMSINGYCLIPIPYQIDSIIQDQQNILATFAEHSTRVASSSSTFLITLFRASKYVLAQAFSLT
jgi:hypothetical protein